MHITLRPDLERYIEDKVRSGDYPDEAAVVSNALQMLKDHETAGLGDWTDEELQSALKPALADLDRGLGTPWNTAEVKADRDVILAARRTPHRPGG